VRRARASLDHPVVPAIDRDLRASRFEEGRQLLDQGWQLYEQWAAGGRPVNPKKAL